MLLWSSWKRCNTHGHQVSPPCVLQLASLRNEEVILDQIAFSNKYVVVMETCNRHRITYQVSLESLRSEEEKCLRLFVVAYKHVML